MATSDSQDRVEQNARILRVFRDVRASLAGRTVSVDDLLRGVFSARAEVEAEVALSSEEARPNGCQPDADTEAKANTPQSPKSTLFCERCLHEPYSGTDEYEDVNHDPDYDPPGISEAELHFHQTQFEKESVQGLHTIATAEAVVTPTEANSESSGGDSVADAAQRLYWQQREEHHSNLRQQTRRAAMPNVDAGDAARLQPGNPNLFCCCFKCGKPGHWAYQCTNAIADNKESTVACTVTLEDLGCQPEIDTRAPSKHLLVGGTLQEAPRCERSCIFCRIARCGRRRGHNAHHNCESMRCLEDEEISIDVRSIAGHAEARETSTSQAASSQDPAPSNFRPCSPRLQGYHVPPCLADSRLGSKLLQRMRSSDWERFTEKDVCEPLAGYELIKLERREGIRGPKSDSCGYCGRTAAKRKCTTCWLTYYCDESCQHQHWKQHKLHCVAPACQAAHNNAVALPDYECFQLYKAHTCQAAGLYYRGPEIALLDERFFISRFGSVMLSRTCRHLARTGKPALVFITVLKKSKSIS